MKLSKWLPCRGLKGVLLSRILPVEGTIDSNFVESPVKIVGQVPSQKSFPERTLWLGDFGLVASRAPMVFHDDLQNSI